MWYNCFVLKTILCSKDDIMFNEMIDTSIYSIMLLIFIPMIFVAFLIPLIKKIAFHIGSIADNKLDFYTFLEYICYITKSFVNIG